MDTRLEGDRRLAATRVSSAGESDLLFRPLASNTYGYHPKGYRSGSKAPSVAAEPSLDKGSKRETFPYSYFHIKKTILKKS